MKINKEIEQELFEMLYTIEDIEHKSELGERVAKLLSKLENLPKIDPLNWFNYFVDYVGNADPDIYNSACEYADYEEKQDIN